MLNRLEIEVTQFCPLQCLHCSVPPLENRNPAFSVQKLRAIFEEFLLLGGKEIVLTGGEPLTIPEDYFLEAFRVLNGVRTFFYTSGQFPSMEVFSKFKNVNLTGMCVTLLGTERTHDLITQVPGSFQKATETIKLLVSLNLFCRIHFTPNALNYSEFANLIDFSFNLGASEFKVFKLAPQGRAQANWQKLGMSLDQQNSFLSSLSIAKNKYQEKIISGGILPGVSDPCSLGKKMAISAEGDIIPCLGLRNRPSFKKEFGNIFKTSLGACWESLSKAFAEKSCICFSCDEIYCGPKSS